LERETTHRLFFALWPDPPARAELDALGRRVSDHPVKACNLHLTLAFLGSRTARERACLEQAAGTLRASSIRLSFDYVGAFPRPRIQWVGMQHCPDALSRLTADLWDVLVPCGVPRDEHRFVPHVTLARRIEKPMFQILDKPIEWKSEELTLVESLQEESGTNYEIISRWPLG